MICYSSNRPTADLSLSLLVNSGSGSARAALVSDSGEIVAESTHETLTRRDDHDSDVFEQSTDQSGSLQLRSRQVGGASS